MSFSVSVLDLWFHLLPLGLVERESADHRGSSDKQNATQCPRLLKFEFKMSHLQHGLGRTLKYYHKAQNLSRNSSPFRAIAHARNCQQVLLIVKSAFIVPPSRVLLLPKQDVTLALYYRRNHPMGRCEIPHYIHNEFHDDLELSNVLNIFVLVSCCFAR